MKNAAPATRYISFFFEHKKGLYFFGWPLIAYVLSLLILCLLGVFLRERLIAMTLAQRTMAFVLFTLIHYGSLGFLLSERLSAKHNKYLLCLGITKQEICFLACIIAVPANLAYALLLFTFTMIGWSPLLSIGISLLMFFLAECICYFSPSLQAALKKNQSTRCNSKKNTVSRPRNFKNPYRAFLAKDIREIKGSEIAEFIVLLFIGVAILAPAGINKSWQSFFLGFYISILLQVFQGGLLFFSKEEKSYHQYYLPQFQLKDKKLLSYKLPLQILIIIVSACMLALFYSLIWGFTAPNLLTVFCLILYFIALAWTMEWFYVQRLKKGKPFDSLYGLSLFPLIIFPGLAFVVALVFLVKKRTKKLSHTSKIKD